MVNRMKQITCQKCGRMVDISKAKPLSTIACPNCGAEVRVPSQIGHFLLVRKLGVGSMGAVYQAYDENLWRQVAMKVIMKGADSDNGVFEECLKESRAMASVNHPNVAQVYELSEDMGQPYIVMELLDGGRFDQLIKSDKVIDEIRVLEIGADIAAGLTAINRLGLVHGDIKPENIMFSRDGTAKLVDFGMAIRWKNTEPDGKVRGTPYYVAPEVARSQKIDPRADIYSLGATLYHALAKRPPFTGSKPVEVIIARLKRPPQKITELRPDLHPQTVALIDRMLAIKPEDRHPAMEDLEHEMRAILGSLRG